MIFSSVLLLHVAIVLLLMTMAGGRVPAPAAQPVQLLVFPPEPEPKPKIRPDNPRPRSARGEAALSITAPDLPALGESPTAAGDGATGSGVDWNAEARRAVQAFEIRRSGAARNEPNPGPLTDDNWWPRVQHHAGEQYKTDNGDWIVWISAACYQIANAAPSLLSGPGATVPRTVCPHDRRVPIKTE